MFAAMNYGHFVGQWATTLPLFLISFVFNQAHKVVKLQFFEFLTELAS
jgi:hypothetical protein